MPPSIVASDSDLATNSLAVSGGQKLIVDTFGKHIVAYVDSVGRLAITFANGDPRLAGAWSPPVKAPAPVSAYKRPALVLAGSDSLKLFAEGGPAAQNLVDFPVTLTRDSSGNIIGVSYGTREILDSSGFAFYPSAIQAHDSSIILIWNVRQSGVISKINALRWTSQTGWTSVSNTGSAQPDTVISDASNTYTMFPSVIERPDNNKLYVFGSRGTGSPTTTLVFNSASYNGQTWSWGTQNLSYESNVARGIEDNSAASWDPVRSLVIVAYDISGTNKYGVFTLNASDGKTHLDTPDLLISDNDSGQVGVDKATGDYYLFVLNAAADGGSGTVGYTTRRAGFWNTTLTVIDSDTTNQGISLQRSTNAELNIIYVKGTTTPTTIKFFSLSTSELKQSSITLNVTPGSSTTGETVTFSGTLVNSADGSGLGGRTVQVQRSFGLATWAAVLDATTNPDGSYSANQVFSFPTAYHLRASFSGDGSYLGSLSIVVDEVVVAANSGDFTFAAAGDHDAHLETTHSLDALTGSGSSFYLSLGDLSYGTLSPETAWCNYVTSHVGSTFPFQLISGNHEDGQEETGQGLIDNFASCLPNRVAGIDGTYAKEYYFDYPTASPLARIILISPDLNFTYGGYYSYKNGTIHQAWLVNAIDSARAAGIPWVILGMHKVCISIGVSSCEISKDLMNLLINKRVDLVLQGHNHDYERSKQLTCAKVDAYIPSCVANDGSTGLYLKGAGTVFVIAGIFGAGLTPVNFTDPESPYFARAFGAGSPGAGRGFVRYTVTATRIDAQLVLASGGPFNDTFSITLNPPENTPPVMTVPGTQTVGEGLPLSFTVSGADSDLPTQTITLSASSLPPGASFPTVTGNPVTGTFSWTPVQGQAGNYTVTLTATDNGTPNLHAAKNVTIIVYSRKTSVISISASPEPSDDATPVMVSGILVDAGTNLGLASQTVTIEQSLDQSTWNTIAQSTTQADGSYQAVVVFRAGTYYLRSSFQGDSNYLPSASPTVQQQVSRSPYALVVTNDGKVYQYQNGSLTLVGRPPGKHLYTVAWRPDGNYALMAGDGGLLFMYNGTTFTSIPTGTTKNLKDIAWRPDGSYALIVGDGGTILRYDGVAVTRLTSPVTNVLLSVSWRPDGTSALIVGKGGIMLTYDNSVVRAVSSGTTADLYAVSWKPNGEYALVAGNKGVILRYNGSSTLLPTAALFSSSLVVRSVAWKPDGSLAILVGDSGLVLTYDGVTLSRLSTLTGSKLYGVDWLAGTATIVGDNGTILAHNGSILQKINGGVASPFRAIDYRA